MKKKLKLFSAIACLCLSVTLIAAVFAELDAISTLTNLSSVKYICENAFYGCTSIA